MFDDAAVVDIVGGAKALRPHQRAGANELVQGRDQRHEARARVRIAMQTAENEFIEANRRQKRPAPRVIKGGKAGGR